MCGKMCPINWRDILSISVTQRRNAHCHHRQLSNYVTGSQVTSFAIPPFCVVFEKMDYFFFEAHANATAQRHLNLKANQYSDVLSNGSM